MLIFLSPKRREPLKNRLNRHHSNGEDDGVMRRISETSLLLCCNGPKDYTKFLVTIVVGRSSSGPMRFPVSGDDTVEAVIDKALEVYDREGRVPVIGSDRNGFVLYSADGGGHELAPSEKMLANCGGTNKFGMLRKATSMRREPIDGDGSRSWSTWLRRSLSFKCGPI
ncbi:hypothetical protein M569_04324 [Genlisea aurea]|uniref:DUF7054 domain-containing protein n=1 Tax=Genlisea aurea TaxID=192259 RepID=S8E413_9LAMI|nr:hypothetical protein M569_04324 [Genlisea aurea]